MTAAMNDYTRSNPTAPSGAGGAATPFEHATTLPYPIHVVYTVAVERRKPTTQRAPQTSQRPVGASLVSSY